MLVIKQFLLGLLGVTAVVVPSSLLTIYVAGNSNSVSPPTLRNNVDIFADRDFDAAPFDVQDAGVACKHESNQKFGKSLLRSNVDWRSTRFDKGRNLWLVVLNGDVGSLQQFEEAIIYCYINPKSYNVSYFKAYDSESNPMLERVGFSFEDIVSFFQ